jgi:hypothetical protein
MSVCAAQLALCCAEPKRHVGRQHGWVRNGPLVSLQAGPCLSRASDQPCSLLAPHIALHCLLGTAALVGCSCCVAASLPAGLWMCGWMWATWLPCTPSLQPHQQHPHCSKHLVHHAAVTPPLRHPTHLDPLVLMTTPKQLNMQMLAAAAPQKDPTARRQQTTLPRSPAQAAPAAVLHCGPGAAWG